MAVFKATPPPPLTPRPKRKEVVGKTRDGTGNFPNHCPRRLAGYEPSRSSVSPPALVTFRSSRAERSIQRVHTELSEESESQKGLGLSSRASPGRSWQLSAGLFPFAR